MLEVNVDVYAFVFSVACYMLHRYGKTMGRSKKTNGGDFGMRDNPITLAYSFTPSIAVSYVANQDTTFAPVTLGPVTRNPH